MDLTVGLVSLGLGLLALIAAGAQVYYGRKAVPAPPAKPDLTTFVRVTPLLQQGSGTVRRKIKILYEDGEVLRDPRLITIGLRNVGTAAISKCTTASPT
jgi:hypothetical protein